MSLAQNVSVGSVELSSVITDVDTLNSTVTVTDDLNWYVGQAAGLYQSIDSQITYCPLTCGNPNFIKRFSPVMQFIFSQSNFEMATVSFSTDMYPIPEEVDVVPKLNGGFGTFPFGTIDFGVSGVDLQMINTYLTKNTTQAEWRERVL